MISISLNGTVVKNISYDEVGNVTSVEDDNGNITRYYYSVKGELIKVIDPVGNVAEYTYSVNGHLISSTKKSPTGEISVINNYGRDLMGQITSITDATGNKESFKYDIKGQLIKKIDKDGYLTKYNYTKQGDVNRIEYADGREVIMSYNELRHLEEVEDWHGITKIQNDGIGRALSVKYPNGEKVSYTYNSAGKRTSLVYPNGKTVNYKYDKMMRLTSLQDGNDVTRYKYDDRGNISAKELPNGIKSSYIYNEFGLLSSIVNEDKDGFLDKYTYTYDAVGRKNSILKQRRNADTENGFYEFKYDLMGRLSEVTQDSTLLRKYEYDTFGNRSTLIEEDAITNYEYNKLNQLVRKTSNADEEIYSYDQRGNLINISTDGTNRHKYSYGALNRLEEATNQEGMRSQYIYNGLGHRIGVENKGNASYTETTNFIIDMTKQYNNLIQKEENG